MNRDCISITGITLHGFHGVYDKERQDGQLFIVDLTLYISTKQASQKDQLSQTVDYGKVVETAAALVTGKPVNLIETLAEHIADALLEEFKKLESLEVTVHKPQAPLSARVDDVAIHITRNRQ